MKLTDMLLEGVYDPHIFKAIFVVGSAGSGKTYLINKLSLPTIGFKIIDSDQEFTYLLGKAGMSQKLDINKIDYTPVRNRATDLSVASFKTKLSGRLGMLITKTGYSIGKVKDDRELLTQLGYDTYIIFINTDLKTCLERNRARDRSIPDDILISKFNAYSANIGTLQNIFGVGHFIIIDNSDNHDLQNNINILNKQINAWLKAPLSNLAKKWIQAQLADKDRLHK